METYLLATETFDFGHPNVQAFIQDFKSQELSDRTLIALYEKVRDFALYDPYHLDLRPSALKASVVCQKQRAWCVEKSLLMVACCRALGVPAKMGFSTVVNHIGADKLEKFLLRKEITFHGYVVVYWNQNWVRCTPAFDRRICSLTKVEPLEWDAQNDSLFQRETENGLFMEYLHEYGEFADIPFDLMESEMEKYYPHLFEKPHNSKAFSFHHRRS